MRTEEWVVRCACRETQTAHAEIGFEDGGERKEMITLIEWEMFVV